MTAALSAPITAPVAAEAEYPHLEYIRRLVDNAPPLSSEIAGHLTRIFRPAVAAAHRAEQGAIPAQREPQTT